MSCNDKIIRNVDEKKAEVLLKQFQLSKDFRERVLELLVTFAKGLEEKYGSIKNLEDPNWALKQAFQKGVDYAVKEASLLLTTNKKD